MRSLTFVETDQVSGLFELMNSKNGTHNDVVGFIGERRPMRAHPFGLDLSDSRFGDNCAFLTHSTAQSVDAMIAHLRWALTADPSKECLKRLRIFNVQHNPDRRREHYCYFEAWAASSVYLCGDCTDFSGGGGDGNRRMRAVFSLLGSLYDVKVEEFEVMHEEAAHLRHPELGIA